MIVMPEQRLHYLLISPSSFQSEDQKYWHVPHVFNLWIIGILLLVLFLTTQMESFH